MKILIIALFSFLTYSKDTCIVFSTNLRDKSKNEDMLFCKKDNKCHIESVDDLTFYKKVTCSNFFVIWGKIDSGRTLKYAKKSRYPAELRSHNQD